jgi:ligand-binding SRPBCC domain-containing protein
LPYRLTRSQRVARPREEVFAFFTDAANLARLAPPSVGFRLLTPLPIRMTAGTLLDYRLRLFSVPVRWRTRIELVEPPARFIDVQLAGPYRRWRHEHSFREIPGGTLIADALDYELPLGPLGKLTHAVIVRRTLAHIFDYRHARVAELLGPELDVYTPSQGRAPT